VKKEEDRKKSSVMKQEQKGLTRCHKDGHPNEYPDQGGTKKEKQKKQGKEQHPYKGTKVDFSG
jgi:hypothetical protein